MMRRSLALRAVVLGAIGIAFVGAPQSSAYADGLCPGHACEYKKPNVMLVLDYSSSMAGNGGANWGAAIQAIEQLVTTDNGYFDARMHLALMRFGHDPDPASPGTTVAGADPAIVDGQSLDVHWYDPSTDPQGYHECNGTAIVDFLASALYEQDDVLTYVVAFGDAFGMLWADEIAMAGGTGWAFHAAAGQLANKVQGVFRAPSNAGGGVVEAVLAGARLLPRAARLFGSDDAAARAALAVLGRGSGRDRGSA